MKQKDYNLSVLLKGAVEKNITLYCPWFGDMKVLDIAEDNIRCYSALDEKKRPVVFDNGGYLKQVYLGGGDITNKSAEVMLFPSADQRDWTKFSIDVFPDLPKTWNELLRGEAGAKMQESGKIPYGEEIKVLQMLLILRDEYRKSSKHQTMKFCIKNVEGTLKVVPDYGTPRIISFQDDLLADKFLECFRDYLGQVKDLI